ncbi:MAG: zf-HC2 domain-containing protein [Planctomycetota bacterium]
MNREDHSREDYQREPQRSCADFATWIARRVDAELDGPEAQQLDAHLSCCHDCRQRLSELQEVRLLIGEVGTTSRIEHTSVSPTAMSPTASPARSTAPSAEDRRKVTILGGSLGLGAAAALFVIGIVLFFTFRDRDDAVAPEPPTVIASVPAITVVGVGSDSQPTSDPLTIRLPSKDPKIHVFWIYPSADGIVNLDPVPR